MHDLRWMMWRKEVKYIEEVTAKWNNALTSKTSDTICSESPYCLSIGQAWYNTNPIHDPQNPPPPPWMPLIWTQDCGPFTLGDRASKWHNSPELSKTQCSGCCSMHVLLWCKEKSSNVHSANWPSFLDWRGKAITRDEWNELGVFIVGSLIMTNSLAFICDLPDEAWNPTFLTLFVRKRVVSLSLALTRDGSLVCHYFLCHIGQNMTP